MEIKELRIGNYISPLGIGFTKVEGFCVWDNLIQSSSFAERGIEDFEPILLTEEWLLKFGFDKNNMYWFDDTNIGFQFHENGVIEWNQPKNIKYVHQLQNLYFALTGKELEIK